MTSSLRGKVVVRTLLACIAIAFLYAGTVAALHYAKEKQARQTLEWMKPVLTEYLWDLDTSGAQSALNTVVRMGEYAEVRILHPDGELFAAASDRSSEIGVFSRRIKRIPLTARGRTIGYLEATWKESIFGGYMWAGFIAALMMLLTWFYGRDLLQRRQLKMQAALQREISERIKTEAELLKAKQAAEQADRIKSEFLANMSHEIRTPLHVILGYTELVERNIPAEAARDTAPFFEYIKRASDRLLDTIQKIIDISRFHIDGYPFVIQPVDLSKTLRSAIDALELLAERKGLHLIQEIPDQPVIVSGDTYAVYHAVANVIDNAIKYTEQGEVRVALHTENDMAVVTVADTGVGISESFLPHVFDEFAQEWGGYNRPFEGTGLGLALCRKFVETCGGSIDIDSRKGQGTTVTIRFPLARDGEEVIVTQEPERAEAMEIPHCAILAVEDDPYTQEFLVTALGKQADLHFARSGEEAMIILDEEKIDIVLMDMSLAGDMDGLELSRTIRASERFRTLPIIALTAHALDRDKEKALDAGCNAFLAKPFPLQQLIETIGRFVSTT